MASINPSDPRPVVIITGCSTGIGKALADLLFKRREYRVVVTAREKSLGELRKSYVESDRFMIRALDITNEEEMSRVVSEVYRKWRSVDIVINNAGISYRSVTEHMDETSELHQLATNYLGPMALIRAVLPSMREKRAGRIINISSVSGMVAMPTMGSYSASKGALEGATESLWYEMKPFGVHVTIIQPGFIHSQSFRNIYFSSKAKLSESLEGPYSIYYRALGPFIERLMNVSRSTPETIALKVFKVMQKKSPALWVPATLDALLFSFLRRFLPNRLFCNLMFLMLPRSSEWSHKHHDRTEIGPVG